MEQARGQYIETFRSRIVVSGDRNPLLTVVLIAITVIFFVAMWPLYPVAASTGVGVLLITWFGLVRRLRRMGVAAFEHGILVRGMSRDRWIPWNDISEFKSFGDLQIVLKSGYTVLGWSVTNANYGWITGKKGEADIVAARLEALMRNQTK